MRSSVVVACVGTAVSLAPSTWAQTPDVAFTVMAAMPPAVESGPAWVRPGRFLAVEIDIRALRARLLQAPLEGTPAAAVPLVLAMPRPDGSVARFAIVESPVMEPQLAAKFPEIRTFLGQGIDRPAEALRCDLTPQGFHAQVLSPEGAWYVDPYSRGNDEHHAVYFRRDLPGPQGFECFAPSLPSHDPLDDGGRSGDQRRTYRLACAATGEYTQFHGGTVSAGMGAITTAVNRVTGIYELELCIRLTLVANNNLIVYTSGPLDPYSNTNGGAMLTQNQSNLDAVIGSSNYDIGHVFSTGGGGVAGFRVVCVTGQKAQGVTGLPSPIGDPFYVDYVAHEVGHQFGGNHSYNGTGGACAFGRAASAAYEPGSASTIMGYAGLCSPDNLQGFSDPYFHGINYAEIRGFITTGSGAACGTLAPTGNSPPTVTAGSSHTIPRGTPYALTAVGSDPDGDPLTYCWEQWNLGPAISLAAGDNGSSPIVRSYLGSTNPTRTIPRVQNLLNNTFAIGEILASTSRTLTFRVTARDNRAGNGGVASALRSLTVTNSAGPFMLTSPNTAVSWSGEQTVTWSVANTNLAPVNTAEVSILLSTNGGQSFPTVLLEATPNTGSAQVILPNISTNQARIKIAAVNNVYFDLSNTNFTITPAPPPPCYANCDNSTLPPILNVGDFTCFLMRYAAGESYANCDQSTTVPVLNVQDFTCFLQRYASGCP